MAWGDDLVAHIDSNSTFTAGTDLFLNTIRDTTTNRRACFVMEMSGAAAVEKFSGVLPAMTQPSADVLVRSTRAIGGDGIAASSGTRSVAQDLWELFIGVTNQTVNSKTYQRINPAHDPYYMGRDEQGRAVFGFRLDGLRAATTN